MNVEVLSRIQFGLTISFHFLFPPMTIGLGVMLILMQSLRVWTGNPLYLDLARFAAAVYPTMVFSTPDHANDLNIYNGSSTAKALQFMFYVAMIGVPVVLTYTATIYYVFRGKVVLTEESY